MADTKFVTASPFADPEATALSLWPPGRPSGRTSSAALTCVKIIKNSYPGSDY